MKYPKIIFGLIGVLGSVAVGVGVVSAAVSCTSATVKEVAIFPDMETDIVSKYAVVVDCDAPSWDSIEATKLRQFMLIKGLGTSGYATALTALSTDKKVSFTVEATTWNSLVTKIRIIK
jgi:hypothetical protein